MHRSIAAAFVVMVFVLTPTVGQAAPADRGEGLGPRIDALIERLSSGDFEDRERAQAELVEIGEPARGALERATESENAEVAARARAALDALGERAFEAFADAFVKSGEAPAGWELPGFEELVEVVGENSASARRLYTWVYRTERELIEAALAVPDDAGEAERVPELAEAFLAIEGRRFDAVVPELKLEFKRAQVTRYEGYELPEDRIGQVMALALAWQIALIDLRRSRIIELPDVVNAGLQVGRQDKRSGWGPFARWITSDAEAAEAARRLYAAHLRLAEEPREYQFVLQSAMLLRQRALSLSLAREMTADLDAQSAHGKFLALHAFMLWGKKGEDLNRVLPFLDSEEEKRAGGWRGNPPRKSVKFSEMALMAIRRMTGGGTGDRDAKKVSVYCSAARFVSVFMYPDAAKLKAEVEEAKAKHGDGGGPGGAQGGGD